jgi:hypothetical protein
MPIPPASRLSFALRVPAADLLQIDALGTGVCGWAPAPGNLPCLESLVEGEQMTIALRLRQSAVDVPKNRLNQASIQL